MQKYGQKSSTENLSLRESLYFTIFQAFLNCSNMHNFFQEYLFSNILVRLRFCYLRTCKY